MAERNIHAVLAEAMGAVRTDRGDYRYKNLLQLGDSHFAARTVLDVGAGDSDFADVHEHTSRVVAKLDPQYTLLPPWVTRNSVGGVVQQLPFRDESFEEVVNMFGLYWLNTGIELALSEMLRVAAIGGHVHIYPAIVTNPSYIDNNPYIHHLPHGVLSIERSESLNIQGAAETIFSAFKFSYMK